MPNDPWLIACPAFRFHFAEWPRPSRPACTQARRLPAESLIWPVGGALLVWFLTLAIRHHDAAGNNTFQDFYRAALALRHGEALSGVGGYIYPPLMAWLLQPLTLLPSELGYRVWQVVTFLFTASSLWIGYREIALRFALPQNARTALTIILGALILSAGEAKTEWSVAQCDSLVLDSFIFSLALLDSSPVVAGAVIAFGVNIKYQTLILLPYLLWRRRFKAAGATVGFTVVFGVLPALTIGIAATWQSWSAALGGLGTLIGLPSHGVVEIHALTWDHSISITSALARLAQLFALPTSVALLFSSLVALMALAAAKKFYQRHRLPIFSALPARRCPQLLALEWSGVMVLLLSFGPQTTRRHLFILLFFHLIIAAHLLTAQLSPRARGTLLAGVLIYQLALRLPPSADWCAAASDAWKFIGGPAWALLGVWLLLVKIVTASIPAQALLLPATRPRILALS